MIDKNELCIKACKYAISKITDKGGTMFGTFKESVNDNGTFEYKYITIDWSEVIDWLVEKEEVEHE